MEKLHTYVPKVDNTYFVIPTHGDAMSVERMIEAQRRRAAERKELQRLDGLEAIPQEFHHRGLMIQV
jgi:hypothetical protein